MSPRNRLVLALSFLTLSALPAARAAAQVAVTAKAGSLGLGAELTAPLSPQIDGRLGVNAFDYSDHRREASRIEYDAQARLRTATALLDWHPGGRSFRLTGGLVWNGNRVDGRSIPVNGSYDIGGVLVPVSIVQRLDARADFNPVAPYLGLGWGHPAASSRRSGVALDLGVMFQGKARVHLSPVIPAGSPVLTTPGAREVLNLLVQREENDLEDEASKYDLYPVASLGIWFRF
jgi:hypothetical protein